MLQLLDRLADIPVIHVAMGDELHHRFWSDNTCRSFCFILLGI